MGTRVLALGGLLAAVAVAAVVLLGGGEDYRLRLQFQNASQLVKGNEVKVGGVGVGTVEEIVLAEDNLAEVVVRITDGDLVPLHEGTRAEVRVSSLSSVANRFVQLHPGPNTEPELRDGATLAASASESVVEIDSVLSTLDAQTRSAAQDLLRNQRTIFEGAAGEANRGLVKLSPALSQLDHLARDIGRDSDALRELLVQTSSVVGAVAGRDSDLDAALGGAATTARALADERAALTEILAEAPATLRDGSRTLRDVRAAFADLRPAARELRPVAPRAAQLVKALQPFLARSGPALDAVQAILPDLDGTLRALPALRGTALPAFEATTKVVDDAMPIVTGARPYVPDIIAGFISGFGLSQADSYDANGMYARVAPIVTQFAGTGALAALTNAPITGSTKGNIRRCPGGAYRTVPDAGNNEPSPGVPCDPEHAP